MEDVERIEVIRGPGAALWGANAVNGVINIITKHSADTQGGLFAAGGGSEERGFGSFRYGGKLNETTSGRAYVKGFERDALSRPAGQAAGDAWSKMQGGFRLDSDLSSADSATLQGDVYHSDLNQQIGLASLTAPYREAIADQAQATGGNLVSRLQHQISDTSTYALQLYFDTYDRREAFIEEQRHTGDVDFQHRFAFNDWNDIVWGVGYRYTYSEVTQIKASVFNFNPIARGESYFSTFLQDQLTLVDEQLWLTLGSKLEHNDYTGIEVQPTARLLWGPDPNHRLWAAVSRGVRIPSRVDAHMELIGQVVPPLTSPNSTPLPLAIAVTGSNAFQAEEVLAYETGYRYTPSNNFSLDVSLFYNDYQNLRSYHPGATDPSNVPFFIKQPLIIDNTGNGKTYGVETAAVWKMLDWWRWDLSYSVLKTELSSNQYYKEAVSPQHKTSLRALLNITPDITLDAWLRYVDNASAFTLSGPAYIKAYTTLDLRLAWKLNQAVELSLVGQNLADSQHLEYIQETFTQATEVQRGVYGKIVWTF